MLFVCCMAAVGRRWFTLQLTLAAAVTDSLDVPDEVKLAHARLGELVQRLAKHLSTFRAEPRAAHLLMRCVVLKGVRCTTGARCVLSPARRTRAIVGFDKLAVALHYALGNTGTDSGDASASC